MDNQKDSDVIANLRLAIIVAASLVFHAVIILGITFDRDERFSNDVGVFKSPALSILLTKRKSDIPISDKESIEQPEQSTNVSLEIPKSVAKDTVEIIEIDDMDKSNTTPTNDLPTTASIKRQPEMERTKILPHDQTVPETTIPSGAELVSKAFEYIRSESYKEKGRKIPFSPMLRMLEDDPLNLKSVTDISAGVDSYVRNDGRTVVSFTFRDGSTVCAEVRERDLLDELDPGSWSILPTGC